MVMVMDDIGVGDLIFPWDKYEAKVTRELVLEPGTYKAKIIDVDGHPTRNPDKPYWLAGIALNIEGYKVWAHLCGFPNAIHFIVAHKQLYKDIEYTVKLDHVEHDKRKYYSIRSITPCL